MKIKVTNNPYQDIRTYIFHTEEQLLRWKATPVMDINEIEWKYTNVPTPNGIYTVSFPFFGRGLREAIGYYRQYDAPQFHRGIQYWGWAILDLDSTIEFIPSL